MGQPTAEVAGEAGTAEAPPARSRRKIAWWAWAIMATPHGGAALRAEVGLGPGQLAA
jgi:hypothetical protein